MSKKISCYFLLYFIPHQAYQHHQTKLTYSKRLVFFTINTRVAYLKMQLIKDERSILLFIFAGVGSYDLKKSLSGSPGTSVQFSKSDWNGANLLFVDY